MTSAPQACLPSWGSEFTSQTRHSNCCLTALQGQEVKDVAKSKHTQALTDVKRLERQKAELLTVLRKQAKLIDVLRRQRAHLEAAQLLSFTEEEFLQTLQAN